MSKTTEQYDTLAEAIDEVYEELREIRDVLVSMGWVYGVTPAPRHDRDGAVTPHLTLIPGGTR